MSTVEAHLTSEPSADFAESLLKALSDSQPNLRLYLNAFPSTEAFGAARLLAVFAQVRQHGGRIDVQLGFPLRPTIVGEAWTFFLHTLSGLLIGQLADSIRDPIGTDSTSTVRTAQGQHLGSRGGWTESAASLCSVHIDEFGRPPAASLLTEKNVSQFADSFRMDVARKLDLNLRDSLLIDAFIDYALQLIDNAAEHGAKDLAGRALHSTRLCYAQVREMSDVRLAHEGQSSPLTEYASALSSDLREVGVARPRLAEFTVGDDGVGIPARMAGTLRIYASSLDEEAAALRAAVRKHVSSKPASSTGAGLGLTVAMSAAATLRGMVIFRTGRLLMYRYYAGLGGSGDPLELFNWIHTAQVPIRGTFVTLLCPLVSSR